MGFGDVIRSAIGPGGSGFGALPSGIGGDANVIWATDENTKKFYKLNPSDFSTILGITVGGTYVMGAGGDLNIALSCGVSSDIINEHNTSDLSIIRTTSSPGTSPTGIGGDSTTIWNCDRDTDKIYELSIVDFSSIRNVSSPGIFSRGIGGDADTIWHVDGNTSILYELSIVDFSVLRSVSESYPGGVGGNSTTIWYCNRGDDRVYELDAANVVTLSGTISDEWGNPIRDADITISNGATYTTTTDENGAYSQLVNPDTYDIAASKSRSRFHDITEASVSVTADTTKNITMPTDRIVGKAGKQKSKGMSIPGGIEL